MLACCLPLTVGTFIGYWFMKDLQIGLTVATLPVMVLAVGIGVDYAFYIYNRLQLHLAHGQPIVKALEHSILEVGTATIFTAITLAIVRTSGQLGPLYPDQWAMLAAAAFTIGSAVDYLARFSGVLSVTRERRRP